MDDVLDEAAVDRVAFMKIDLEGQEYRVLKGAAMTLERVKPSIFSGVRSAGTYSITLLGDIGYRFYNLDRRDSGRWERSSTAAIESLFSGHNDILCWHPGERESTPPPFVGGFDGTRFG